MIDRELIANMIKERQQITTTHNDFYEDVRKSTTKYLKEMWIKYGNLDKNYIRRNCKVKSFRGSFELDDFGTVYTLGHGKERFFIDDQIIDYYEYNNNISYDENIKLHRKYINNKLNKIIAEEKAKIEFKYSSINPMNWY